MMWVEIALAVLLAFSAPLILLFARRRHLSNRGGVFDCGLRLRAKTPGSGWVLGLARYEGEDLEWYRSLSLSLKPFKKFRRTTTRVVGYRHPDQVEAVVLFDYSRIVRLVNTETDKVTELSMATDSMTGLLSWLEASPPSSEFDRPS